jgi:adenine deaminase
MLKNRIFAATKKIQSDLVITHITIVDVFSQDTYIADVAIKDGVFAGIGNYKGHGKVELDGSGKFIIPGLIDAHAHIESTLVTPIEYSNTSLPHGITGVIADPHEIANVCGVAGIDFIIENGRQVPMDIYVMLPSCVPATSFENAGCTLSAEDLKPLYANNGVYGLAEVMDFPAVLEGDHDMLQKLEDADTAGYRIDGHAAGFSPDQLNAYGVAHIRTDHECDTSAGLIERVRRGIYTLVREGTVCKDLLKMLPAINEKNSHMLCFATDDKHLDDLCMHGGVDVNVRLAIANGLNPATAIQMASLNTARCYKLDNLGAIAPGYIADFSIVSNLDQLTIEEVYKNGRIVAKNGQVLHRVDPGSHKPPQSLLASVRIPAINEDDLKINMNNCRRANIIQIVPGTVVSNHLIEEVKQENGEFKICVDRDQLKIAVIERHKNLGNIATGIVKGLRLQHGAIATTIAHDSHNLIVVGTNEADMVHAVSAINKMQGGIVVIHDGECIASLTLEIGGLISSRQAEEVADDLHRLHQAITKLAPACTFNPLLALSFMSLVVIPELKICDSGLFDFSTFGFIEVPVKD